MDVPKTGPASEFNGKSPAIARYTDFFKYLKGKFGEEAAEQVVETFQKMMLPVPEKAKEFIRGCEGGHIFLNKYGLVIRIENKVTRHGYMISDRINDNPWIVKPLASIDAGNAVIEICPGCQLDRYESNVAYVHSKLRTQGVEYWDSTSVRNNGLRPFKTAIFPRGIPIVIDRLAVKLLSDGVAPIMHSLWDAADKDAAEADKFLYAPLVKAWQEAWQDPATLPDKEKMQAFFALCEQHLCEGKLVAGWNDTNMHEEIEVASDVYDAAKAYDQRLQQVKGSQLTLPLMPVAAPASPWSN